MNINLSNSENRIHFSTLVIMGGILLYIIYCADFFRVYEATALMALMGVPIAFLTVAKVRRRKKVPPVPRNLKTRLWVTLNRIPLVVLCAVIMNKRLDESLPQEYKLRVISKYEVQGPKPAYWVTVSNPVSSPLSFGAGDIMALPITGAQYESIVLGKTKAILRGHSGYFGLFPWYEETYSFLTLSAEKDSDVNVAAASFSVLN